MHMRVGEFLLNTISIIPPGNGYPTSYLNRFRDIVTCLLCHS